LLRGVLLLFPGSSQRVLQYLDSSFTGGSGLQFGFQQKAVDPNHFGESGQALGIKEGDTATSEIE
jgi:hypothetical protein